MVKKDSNYNENLAQLLSEYLDGQLPPEQAEKVEKLLAENPQARRLLAEIRQVSQTVRQLPRVPAPDDLAEQIQLQLERDVLLGPENTRLEPARRKYPRLRRWLAAAAMLMLTGAVVFILYSVLIGPPPLISPPEETPPIVPGVVAIESEPEPPVQDQPQFSLVHLQIPSDNLIADQDKLERLLEVFNIQQVDHTRPDTSRADFAFDYPLDQLEQIVEALMADPNQYIDLIFDDEIIEQRTIIADVSVTEVMILAGLRDPDTRNAVALELIRDRNFLRRDEPPEWLQKDILRDQPPFGGLGNLADVPTARDPNAFGIPEPNIVVDEQPTTTTEQTTPLVEVILTLQLVR